MTDKANDKSEIPQGNYGKSKPDGQVRIRVPHDQMDCLMQLAKEASFKSSESRFKHPKECRNGEEVGRSVRKNRAMKEKKLAKVD